MITISYQRLCHKPATTVQFGFHKSWDEIGIAWLAQHRAEGVRQKTTIILMPRFLLVVYFGAVKVKVWTAVYLDVMKLIIIWLSARQYILLNIPLFQGYHEGQKNTLHGNDLQATQDVKAWSKTVTDRKISRLNGGVPDIHHHHHPWPSHKFPTINSRV